MEILNELGNDLAFAFLVEKKHGAKIDSKSALALIERVRKVLQPVSKEEKTSGKIAISEKSVGFSSH
jgi:hypothetical protein